jgi:alginate O-acetyltransferase complex protein AlgJ
MPLSRTARRAAAVALAAALLVPGAHGTAVSGEGRRAPDPVAEREALQARSNPLTAAQFTGVDGKTHKSSPILVRGRHGTVFFGEEMDGACGYGKMFDKGLVRLAALASLIEKSGRRVVFTVPPNKSAVQKRDILKSQLPHGRCDLMGIAQQDRVLDTFRNNDYLPLRKTLAARAAAGQRHLYWPIDTHWTRLGAQVFVKGLASHLDPKLGARQTARRGKETIETDVSFLGVIPETYETAPALYTTTPVKVSPANGSPAYDPAITFSAEHRWISKPAQRTWRGRTLIIGDSFTYRALDNLMPLFARGRFLWYGQVTQKTLVDAIPAADTVVIAMTQRYLPIAPLTQPPFKRQLRRALGG